MRWIPGLEPDDAGASDDAPRVTVAATRHPRGVPAPEMP